MATPVAHSIHSAASCRAPSGSGRPSTTSRTASTNSRTSPHRFHKRARQFFEYAKDCKIITDNPFAKIRAGSQRNTSRKFFVSREVIEDVLAACPDNEWRLIVVLARYGGLRIPSELEELTWERIDWEHNRFTVIVKKKEHIDGHGTRVVPIFPEIRPYLEKAWAEAPTESLYVVPRGRTGNVNLRTGLFKIMARAGVAQWPKLFVNLRASRETELMRTEPAHIVHAWLGNSKEVAEDHYLMVTDEDFERASKGTAGFGAEVASRKRSAAQKNPDHIPDHSVQVRCNPERSPKTKTPAHPADREVCRCSDTPTGSRTPVFGLRTRRPGPLDDGGVCRPLGPTQWF